MLGVIISPDTFPIRLTAVDAGNRRKQTGSSRWKHLSYQDRSVEMQTCRRNGLGTSTLFFCSPFHIKKILEGQYFTSMLIYYTFLLSRSSIVEFKANYKRPGRWPIRSMNRIVLLPFRWKCDPGQFAWTQFSAMQAIAPLEKILFRQQPGTKKVEDRALFPFLTLIVEWGIQNKIICFLC